MKLNKYNILLALLMSLNTAEADIIDSKVAGFPVIYATPDDVSVEFNVGGDEWRRAPYVPSEDGKTNAWLLPTSVFTDKLTLRLLKESKTNTIVVEVKDKIGKNYKQYTFIENDIDRTKWIKLTNFRSGSVVPLTWSKQPVSAIGYIKKFGEKYVAKDGREYISEGTEILTKDDEVFAMASGTVLSVEAIAGMGNTVFVDHGGGFITVYAGLKNVSVKIGESTSGQKPIGEPLNIDGTNRVRIYAYLAGIAQNTNMFK